MKFSFAIVALAFSLNLFARPVRGTYEVPVPEELKAFAQYPVKFKADNYEAIPQVLNFPLPQELTGIQQEIAISRIENTDTWSSADATATCAKVGRYFRCEIKFHNLLSDLKSLEAHLKNTYLNPVEFQARLEVAKVFLAGEAKKSFKSIQGEPFGILLYKLRGRDSE